MTNVVALPDPRVLARLDAIERRLAEIDARHSDDVIAAGEVANQIITIGALLEAGSASGGATASNGDAA
jgi:hypothetical protein